jgi:hypothetical protein
MNDVDRKMHKALVNGLSDLRVSVSAVAHNLIKEPLAIQEQFVTMSVSYFKSMALMHKSGIVPIHLVDMARVSEYIHDECLVPLGLSGELDMVPREREEKTFYLQV